MPTLSAARSFPDVVDQSIGRVSVVSSDDVADPVAILAEATGTELNRRPLLKELPPTTTTTKKFQHKKQRSRKNAKDAKQPTIQNTENKKIGQAANTTAFCPKNQPNNNKFNINNFFFFN